jgi:hypothetical protein
MSDTPKILGQVQSSAGVATKLYTGAANGAIARLMVNVRGTSGTNANVGIELRIGGAGAASKDFYFEGPVAQFSPQQLVFAVGADDEVWVTSDIADVNFHLTGIEP